MKKLHFGLFRGGFLGGGAYGGFWGVRLRGLGSNSGYLRGFWGQSMGFWGQTLEFWGDRSESEGDLG